MALHLWRPKHRFPNNPSLIHLFSTSPPDENDNQNPTPNTNRTTFNYFPDIKSGLKTQSTSTPPNSEILKNLAQFRQRTVPPPPTGESTSSFSPSQSSNFSFQESFIRNRNNGVQNRVTHSIDSIRQIAESLKMKSMNVNRGNTTSGGIANSSNSSVGGFNIGLSGFSGSRTVGGTQELPITIFGKEMQANSGEAKLTLLRTYTFDNLGEKLSQLRPEGVKNGEGFSLQELNERLQKLMELDNNKSQSAIRGVLQGVSAGLQNVQDNQNKKKRNVDLFGRFTPRYMEYPPKELLVEKYFHPDNMSSAEKMKIELAKVRDEFKMSESDCGSSRVQVAQLTTKIKHLSSVLHKRDKHSLKGLQAMVQKRKRLLKYLRRTDWDSYCFVLSKLGLRDNPDYKA